ncbi:hypothetical protein [Vibrio sp. R78045]|uniref:hypothetical protein n=1 Tax=Vibrio sp. R78045 TaxID=3093868 RepID=UPI0036F390F4
MSHKIYHGNEYQKGQPSIVILVANSNKEAAITLGVTDYKFRKEYQHISSSEFDAIRNNGWRELPPYNELVIGKLYKKSEYVINQSRNELRERNLEEIGQLAKIECAIHQIQGCHSIKKGLDPKLRRIAGELHEILGDMREDFNEKYVGISLKKPIK